MAKRFTDTQKWQDEWYMDLPAAYKLFYLYLLDNCDHAGIWKVNFKLASFHIGQVIDQPAAEEFFAGRILEFKPGYWYILKFIDFQYGGIKNDSVGKSISNILKINNIEGAMEGLPRGYQAPKVKDKDKDKVKDIINNGKKFEYNEVAVIPENYIQACREQLYATQRLTIDKDTILKLWEAFRLEKITGDIFYSSEKDIFLHFVNWIKKQKFSPSKLKSNGTDWRTELTNKTLKELEKYKGL